MSMTPTVHLARFDRVRPLFVEGSPIRKLLDQAVRGYFTLEVLSVGSNWASVAEIRAKQVLWLERCEATLRQAFDYSIP